MQINSFTKSDDTFSITIQSNIPDEDEEAVTHIIELTDGILKFRDH